MTSARSVNALPVLPEDRSPRPGNPFCDGLGRHAPVNTAEAFPAGRGWRRVEQWPGYSYFALRRCKARNGIAEALHHTTSEERQAGHRALQETRLAQFAPTSPALAGVNGLAANTTVATRLTSSRRTSTTAATGPVRSVAISGTPAAVPECSGAQDREFAFGLEAPSYTGRNATRRGSRSSAGDCGWPK